MEELFSLDQKKIQLCNKKIKAYRDNDDDRVKIGYDLEFFGKNFCGHLHDVDKLESYWNRKGINDPICKVCKHDHIFVRNCIQYKKIRMSQSSRKAFYLLDSQNFGSAAITVNDEDSVALLRNELNFSPSDQLRTKLAMDMIIILTQTKDFNKWHVFYDAIIAKHDSAIAFHNICSSIMHLQLKRMHVNINGDEDKLKWKIDDKRYLYYPTHLHNYEFASKEEYDNSQCNDYDDIDGKLMAHCLSRNDFFWMHVLTYEELLVKVSRHGFDVNKWKTVFSYYATPLTFQTTGSFKEFLLFRKVALGDNAEKSDVIMKTLLPIKSTNETNLELILATMQSAEYKLFLIQHNNFYSLFNVTRSKYFYIEWLVIYFKWVIEKSRMFPAFSSANMFSDMENYEPISSKKIEIEAQKHDGCTDFDNFFIKSYFRFLELFSKENIRFSTKQLSEDEINALIFASNGRVTNGVVWLQFTYHVLKTFLSQLPQFVLESQNETKTEYFVHMKEIYKFPWISLIKNSNMVIVLANEMPFRQSFALLKSAQSEPNANIISTLNDALRILSIYLPIAQDIEETKVNIFYDMIATIVEDLAIQKDIHFTLTFTEIPNDSDHILVQIRPQRKKNFGIFAKHHNDQHSTIDYPIDGKRRSFLVMHYFFAPNRKPTAGTLLTSTPDTISLEFMDLDQPKLGKDAEVYSIDDFDRLEFPGGVVNPPPNQPMFSQAKLSIFWGFAVGAFKGLSLIDDGQNSNKKIIIFKNNPKRMVTVQELRVRLRSLYPHFKNLR